VEGTGGRVWLVDPLCGTLDGPLDRPFVGAQLAADPDFRAQFAPRVESTTLALAWVAAGRRLAYVTDLDGAPVHTGPGLVAAADSETHAALLRIVARHRP
jgi:myo-inositol-1(or 4)-monophosphatase